MSQPPPGGFPPPDDPPVSGPPEPGAPSTGPQQAAPTPPGAYPPPSGPPPGYLQPPQGPPPGYQQSPPPGYQQSPPPGYQQGPPPGYQQGPPPGYQQGPPPGYQGQPQQGGYPPPQPGYGPPQGQEGPPPGYGPPPGAPGGYGPPAGAYPPPPGAAAKPSFDASKVTIAGWGVLGASALTLIASFFSFWHVSYTAIVSASVGLNGWSLWWWIPVLLAVAVGVVYALQLFGVLSKDQVKPEWLAYAAAASFILMIGVLVQTFFYGGGYSAELGDIGLSFGPSFGVFFALITTAALAYFTALVAQGAGAKLPVKVPGPA